MEITKIKSGNGFVPKRIRTAAYARVSSGKDAMLHSLSAQVSYYSKLIQSRPDLQYAGVYADEAKTGTKGERPEFQKMLTECRNGKIDLIITKSISRFSRNTVTLLETVRWLEDLNIDVFFEVVHFLWCRDTSSAKIHFSCRFIRPCVKTIFIMYICILNQLSP